MRRQHEEPPVAEDRAGYKKHRANKQQTNKPPKGS
jgi:hypothetical protein